MSAEPPELALPDRQSVLILQSTPPVIPPPTATQLVAAREHLRDWLAEGSARKPCGLCQRGHHCGACRCCRR